MPRIRIAAIVPDKEDPTSWYRGVGPLSEIETRREDIELTFPANINWSTLKFCHILFMQRPHLPDYLNAMAMAKDHGIPTWIDLDDDNLAVPKDNPVYQLYNQVAIKDSIVKMARYAEIVTVATETLKKKYDIYRPSGRECIVVPNALDDDLLIHRNIQDRERDKLVLWRGTLTHHKNLSIIADSIIEVANKNPQFKFTFFGWEPLFITEHIKNFQYIGSHHIMDYHKVLIQLHPYLMYYALANNEHAQSRSHVSWLEATFAGIPFIGPKHPEFDKPGIFQFANNKEFKDVLEAALRGDLDLKKGAELSWEHLKEFYMLSRVNQIREQIINGLVK